MITKEQYAQKHQSEIEALNREIENLDVDIKEARADAEGEHDNKDYLLALCQRRDEVKAKLVDLQAAGDDGWKDVKYGVKHTWMAMKESFANIISRLTA